MKNLLLIVCTSCFWLAAGSQTYWQQQADFTIDVSLNEADKTLDGFERIIYTNHSPDTLRFLWFHLWPNAYKNDRTAFSDQRLQNGKTDFYFAPTEHRGYINRLAFKVDGATATTEDHPQYIDVIKVVLPKPLLPGATASITTPFHVKLPANFSRGGYTGNSFQITQWYPKPAVYDRTGWHPMPYLDQGEFYSEFGRYDVRITLPKEYVVAATGELQDASEMEWLKTRPQPAVQPQHKIPATAKSRLLPRLPLPKSTVTTERKTLHFKQDVPVHDFAWFADKSFVVSQDTVQLPSGRSINIRSFYWPQHKEDWKGSAQFAKDAIRFYSRELIDYPYASVSVVEAEQTAGGGMEYPTITAIAPTSDAEELDQVIAHEVGHNWFYGVLASNERLYPWMDEGMNSFYEEKYMQQKYGSQTKELEVTFQTVATNRRDQPIATTAEDFSWLNYGLSAYHKTAEWLKGLEQTLGVDSFRQLMKRYATAWQFRHPQPEDFKRIAKAYLGNETDPYFSLLDKKGVLPQNALIGTSVVFPLKKNAIDKYLKTPTKNAVIVLPALGFNVYDKLMLGGLVSNYGSPAVRLNFLAVPLYASGSKSLTGLGKVAFALRSAGRVRRTDLFVNASSFTINDFISNEGNIYRMRFSKIVPGFRLTFRESSPRSTTTTFLQWKTFFVTEQALAVAVDSIKTPIDTTIRYRYSTPSASRYLNQLQFGIRNLRALYPFDATLQAEQATDFVRTTLTANYFFNYPRTGGLSVRFFAGKFFYLGEPTLQKRFGNERFHLNMTGANGYEDYTYSDYFLGRNEFSGLSSQQIMVRDGGFKVRTDLLSSKVGKTDNWLMAANFSTTIPQKLNPLSVLPIKIPLRLFADIGTYAEAWDRNTDTDRFLFDFGLHLPLFKETVNIYLPLFYSKVYGDYFKSTLGEKRFWKTVSFSINFYNKELKKLNRELEF